MITLLLLPFFLACRVSVDLDSWFYGPEYTYQVRVIVSRAQEEGDAKANVFDVSSTLKCRPHVPDTLYCRFDTAKLGAFTDGIVLGPEAVEDWEISDEPFEIKFDRAGVARLVVTKLTSPWILDTLRAIVNQLNFGMDFRGRPNSGRFAAVERSYLGECKTRVDVVRRPAQTGVQGPDGALQIIPLSGFRKSVGETVEIRKSRNMNECENKGSYYFASEDSLIPRQDVTVTVVTSESRIIIADGNYTAYTTNDVIQTNRNLNRNVTLHEMIILTLESVVPAKTELQMVPYPLRTSIFVRTPGSSAPRNDFLSGEFSEDEFPIERFPADDFSDNEQMPQAIFWR